MRHHVVVAGHEAMLAHIGWECLDLPTLFTVERALAVLLGSLIGLLYQVLVDFCGGISQSLPPVSHLLYCDFLLLLLFYLLHHLGCIVIVHFYLFSILLHLDCIPFLLGLLVVLFVFIMLEEVIEVVSWHLVILAFDVGLDLGE